MPDLKTKFMGIEIKNPIVVGACNLSKDKETLIHLEKAGAGAIVYKSLFEEQIQYERLQFEEKLHEFDERHAEMISIHPNVEHAGPKEHLAELKKAKKALSIPLIASLNAVYKETWVEYAKLIEETGVDGLELNFYTLPREAEQVNIVDNQVEMVRAVREAVSIPIAVKLGPFYSNPLNVMSKIDEAGANGFVLFNRFFHLDIDVDNEKITSPFNLSKEGDHKLPLKFTGLLYNKVKGSICSNTGIFTGKDMAKMILAGAECVQIVSAVYKYKAQHIEKMLKELEFWMNYRSYKSVDDFRGKLSDDAIKDPFAYARAQYVDILMNPENIIKEYTDI